MTTAAAWANCTVSPVPCAVVVPVGVAWSTVGVVFPVEVVSAIVLPCLFQCSRGRYRPGYSKSPAFKWVPGQLTNSMAGIIDHGRRAPHPPYGVQGQKFLVFAESAGPCGFPRFSAVFSGFSPSERGRVPTTFRGARGRRPGRPPPAARGRHDARLPIAPGPTAPGLTGGTRPAVRTPPGRASAAHGVPPLSVESPIAHPTLSRGWRKG